MTTTYPISLDYPIHPTPRYGWGKPVHPQLYHILNKNRTVYEQHLQAFLSYQTYFTAIPKYPSTSGINQPAWINGSLPGLDAVALYGFVAIQKPKRYMEIGVGNSTKFAKRAILDHGLDTRILAIDPYPMSGVEAICDTLIQQPLEEVNLRLFEELEAGDILFVDSSHRVFMNSDVTVIFLEILPRLQSGVWVEFHDIAWPLDYPPQWEGKYYSEQYLLAAYLLAEGQKFEVMLPNAFISLDENLREIMSPLWQDNRLNGNRKIDLLSKIQDGFSNQPQLGDMIDTHGSSFWIQMKS